MTPATVDPIADSDARGLATAAYLRLFERHLASESARPQAAARLLGRWLPELTSVSWADFDPEAVEAVRELVNEAELVSDANLSLQWLSTFPTSLLAVRAVKYETFEVTISWSETTEDWDDFVADGFWSELELSWPSVAVHDDETIEFALAA